MAKRFSRKDWNSKLRCWAALLTGTRFPESSAKRGIPSKTWRAGEQIHLSCGTPRRGPLQALAAHPWPSLGPSAQQSGKGSAFQLRCDASFQQAATSCAQAQRLLATKGSRTPQGHWTQHLSSHLPKVFSSGEVLQRPWCVSIQYRLGVIARCFTCSHRGTPGQQWGHIYFHHCPPAFPPLQLPNPSTGQQDRLWGWMIGNHSISTLHFTA